MVRTWAIVVFALVGGMANGTVVEPRELGEIVKESVYVGSVWIEQSTSISDGPASSYPVCGASYRARTVDVLKGSTGVVTFFGSEDLVVGREYLVFLAQGLRSTTVVVSTSSLSGAPTRSKHQWIADCAGRHPGVWSMNGSAATFIDRRMKIEIPGHLGDRWVALPSFLDRFDMLPQFDTDKIGAPWSFGPTPYPSGIYLSWQSVRKLLLQAIAKTTPNTSLKRTREK